MSSTPAIPAITIDSTEVPYDDQSPLPGESEHSPASLALSPSHQRSPSDPNYLAPGGSNVGVKPSQEEPSSPTGSNSSIHFATSVDLRHNQPDAYSGAGSLALLNPGAMHGRKNSATSLISAEGTEPDHGGQPMSPSALSTHTSFTAVPPPTPDHKSRFPHGKEGNPDAKHDTDAERPPEITDVENCAPFAFRPKALAEMAENKNIEGLAKLGGTNAILKGLGTDASHGLSSHALGEVTDEKSGGEGAFAATRDDRIRVYGLNIIPPQKTKTLLQLMWLALKDKVLVLLCIAAVISLALGLYQDIGVTETIPCSYNPALQCTAPKVDFVEGVAIIIAVVIVVLVGSINDWQKERQFRALNEKKEDRAVKVIRKGHEQLINIKDVLVGDIATLEPGEILPCDGILVSGYRIRCDESSVWGESDPIRKHTFDESHGQYDGEKPRDCFVLSGSKVLEGVGRYVVVAVGERSFNGRILMALRKPTAATPLQEKLNDLAELIAKVGAFCGLILFGALMIKFFIQLKTEANRKANAKAMQFIQILIISVTVVVVAVPEGLPLAVTLALAFATKRMTREHLLVRVLDSCEVMANATVVCTDKTGTLTQNVMTVVAGSAGVRAKFVSNLKENIGRAESRESSGDRKHPDDFAIDQADLSSIFPPALKACFNEAIAINSTAFEDTDPETGKLVFVGSKTETALLRFAKEQGWRPYQETRDKAQVVQMLPFDSKAKYMAAITKRGSKYRVYFKGASEILTHECTRHVVVRPRDQTQLDGSEDDPIETKEIDEKIKENIANTIIFYANQMLRTIALCYRDVDQWPPPGKQIEEVSMSDLAHDMTLLGITGIEDPLRPCVRDAINDAVHAGVTVKMCTGDNVLTARSIAAQCGIYTPGGVIMEGPVFRALSNEERAQVVPFLQVLARSSPDDKKILVETLLQQGEIVGVTGDGTNDGPALKEASVGFSMGIAGTEVAKEASDIILMDDNFASIVSAIIWGRCVNDAVRKFLQFQISVNICAVLITFISAVASASETSVLTAVQLLWINIIMDTFAALALATDPATRKLLDRKPDRREAPLFTVEMGKMIIGQALYQTFIVLLLHFAGPKFFHVAKDDSKLATLVFNVFVFCQIFNSINCRTIDGTLNVFDGILKNWYFMIITLTEIVIQIIIVFVGGDAFTVSRISGKYWGISIGLGIVSLPLGALIRLTPNAPLQRFLVFARIMKDPESLPLVTPHKEEERYNDAIEHVREDLTMFANIRGARLRASSMALNKKKKKKQAALPRLPSIMAMVPSIVASSVAARWQPQINRLHDPANGDPSRSSAALWNGKLSLHPDTEPTHPAYVLWKEQLEKRPFIRRSLDPRPQSRGHSRPPSKEKV